MRRRHDEIRAAGGEIVAVGTGDARYAKAFVADENIPFPVLVDDDGEAARFASLKSGSLLDLAGPKTFGGALRAIAHGNIQHRMGKRPRQLGATFVVGPGDVLRYEHLDETVADHAPFDEVLQALG